MPNFRYVAKDNAGRVNRGHAEASDEKALRQLLQALGLLLLDATHDSVADSTTPSPSDQEIPHQDQEV